MKGKHAQKNFGAVGAMAPPPLSLKTGGGGGGWPCKSQSLHCLTNTLHGQSPKIVPGGIFATFLKAQNFPQNYRRPPVCWSRQFWVCMVFFRGGGGGVEGRVRAVSGVTVFWDKRSCHICCDDKLALQWPV